MVDFLKNIIDKRVDKRINEILKSDSDFSPRNIPDEKARKEMTDFILEKKRESITRLSVLDFVMNLKLPADQVSRIIEDFKSENKLKEIDD